MINVSKKYNIDIPGGRTVSIDIWQGSKEYGRSSDINRYTTIGLL